MAEGSFLEKISEQDQEVELERMSQSLLRNILEYKEKKNTQYVGKEKLFYQHLAEVLIE